MSELEITKHSLDQQNNVIIEKEREAVKRVQSAREEEWKKLHTIQDEKYVMDETLSWSCSPI